MVTKSSEFAKKDIGMVKTYQSGVAQAAAHRLINRVVTNYLLIYKLSPMQWFAVGYIYDAGESGIRMGDLAKELGTTLPYITNKVALLESKGMVEKLSYEGDSRIKILKVTDEFSPIIEEIENGLRIRMRKELYHEDNITREELNNYVHVLYKIIGN